MRVLFGGPLAPLGWKVGFLRVPFADGLRATVEWRQSLAARFGQRLRVGERVEFAGKTTLLETMRSLDPLQTPPKKELLVATDGEWTINLVNDHLGGDSVSWVGHLSRKLECEGIIAGHIPEGQYPFPSTSFELLGPKGAPPLRYVRTINAGKYDSGRWEFRTSGPPQSFEDTSQYSARRVRDRFDRALLIRYLAARGIEPDRPDLFRAAVLLETEAAFPVRESSLLATRRDYGIDSEQ